MVNKDNGYKAVINEKFFAFFDKKILIYGTGIIAERLIATLKDFNLVGCLDGTKLEGKVGNVPIISWDDVCDDTADIVVIAAKYDNYKVIYNRIIYKCACFNMEIYGENGVDLRKKYLFTLNDVSASEYFSKSKEQLKRIIDEYDAVSFDLFDTLVMRRTLEPVDVFDLVEEKLADDGILIPEFKKKRRTAELESKGGDIYSIYRNLQKRLVLDDAICHRVLYKEIECEKLNIIPRIDMLEIFQYALSGGKRVSIITDMYLTTDILKDILSGIGINGYENLFVSCEHGKGKGNGIFEEYKKTVVASKYLHIGDNLYADVIAPSKYGIDSYEVKSAAEMLAISSLRGCLEYTNNRHERGFIGSIISDLFNSPFSLFNTMGVVRIKSFGVFSRLFVLPAVLSYVHKLMIAIEEKNYDGILFGARDGYLIKKVVDRYYLDAEKHHIKSIYFLASRKLALKSTIFCESDLEKILRYIEKNGEVDKIVETVFGVGGVAVEEIINLSAHTRNRYLNYMKKNGIKLEGRYLFCDLVSSGTVHDSLNKLFRHEQDGLYLFYNRVDDDRKLAVESVFSNREWKNDQRITNLLESILTAPTPSIIDIDMEGVPVYDMERRSNEEIQIVKQIQDIIVAEAGEFTKGLIANIDKRLIYRLLTLSESVIFEDEMAFINDMQLIDDVKMNQFAVVP